MKKVISINLYKDKKEYTADGEFTMCLEDLQALVECVNSICGEYLRNAEGVNEYGIFDSEGNRKRFKM